MADGKIEIETEINTKGLDKDIKGLKGKLANLGNTSTLKGLSNIGATIIGVGVAFKAATATVKAAKAVIDDLSETYKVQAQAETQLAQAAKNNPYLLSSSVTELKRYASELQSISTYGDEQLLPFMAQLASSGRTQEEIMKIMSASVDLAASGMMSLDSAVSQLNGTYNGNIGQLGRQIGELKGLTEEELKQGEAVDIIAGKYKDMAKEVAKTTGTSQQLKNAMGDLKEELGAPFEKAMGPVRAFFTELISGWADAKRARREAMEADEKNESGQGNIDTLTSQVERLEKELEERAAYFAEATDLEKMQEKVKNGRGYVTMDLLKTANEEFAKRTAEMEQLLEERKAQLDEAVKQETEAAEKAKKAKKEAEEKSKLEAEIEARDKLRAVYDETIRAKQEEIKQRRITGEEISEETEAQEMYNTALQAYIKMMSDPAFKGNSGNFSHETDARKQIADWGEIAGKDDLKKQLEEFKSDIKDISDELEGVAKNQYDALLETLDAEYQAVIDNKYLEEEEKLRIEEEYAEMRKKLVEKRNEDEENALQDKLDALNGKDEGYWGTYRTRVEEISNVEKEIRDNDAKKREELQEKYKDDETALGEALVALDQETADRMKAIDEAYASARASLTAGIMNDVAYYTSQTVDIINQAASLMLETSRNEAAAEQAELEAKYRKGEISEEEYNEKLTESKKKAAKEQYKIQMVQWSASILEATANIAQGVTKAIALGGPAGLITGGLVAAAGAVQIANIIASKPTPPNFAGGGFIGGMNGATMGSDNTYIHARTGEMVANAAQQRNLWEAMNGNGGGSGTNIIINNSASNIATAQPKLSRDKIEIMIDARVNDSLKNGRYDKSLTQAQSGMSGDYYGI